MTWHNSEQQQAALIDLSAFDGHTPGQWWAGTDEDANCVYASLGPDHTELVAETTRDDGDSIQEAANAHLIAAAPALLARVEQLERINAQLLAACKEGCHALGVAQDNVSDLGGPGCSEARFFNAPMNAMRDAIVVGKKAGAR